MPAIDPSHRDLAALQEAVLGRAATAIAGFEFGDDAEFASAATVTGLRAGPLVFSRRHDSLTIFASDSRYGYGAPLGAWTGSDDELSRTAASVLEATGIPAAEIADIQVVSEFGATAQRVSDEEFRVEETEVLRKVARFSRTFDGMPVWSSYAQVGLTAEGRVGNLEIHWPDILSAVAEEARLLSALADRGRTPPEVAGAVVESVEAGILHSPAIGFFMDIVAATRVIYRGNDPTIGRKPIRYLDRNGEEVSAPRDILRTDARTAARPRPTSTT